MFIKKISECPEFEAADMTILRELLHPVNDRIDIGYSLASARLPLGEASLPHKLSGSELYYIVSGKGRLYVNNESSELNPGDSALVPPNAEQFIENIGAEELVFLCIVEPYWRPEGDALV